MSLEDKSLMAQIADILSAFPEGGRVSAKKIAKNLGAAESTVLNVVYMNQGLLGTDDGEIVIKHKGPITSTTNHNTRNEAGLTMSIQPEKSPHRRLPHKNTGRGVGTLLNGSR